jgi:uncharacterized protein (TIGR03546 family)
MILPGFVSKVLVILRGGIAPVLIFLSILLGLWFGMVPGFSGFHAILLVLIILLNVPIGITIFWIAIGKGLCLAAAPLLYHIGIWIHSNMTFIVRLLESLPVIGLTNFNRYAVMGGFVIGPIVGVIVGLFVVASVVKFRRTLLKLEEGSEMFKKWHSKTWVYILDRILIGKRTKDAKSLFTVKAVYIRKAGLVLVILVVAGLVAAGIATKNGTIKNYAIGAMTRANGAEVDLGNLGISLTNGSVSVSGIQATNPQDPNKNQVSVAKLSADAGIYDLLVGKLVLEKVEMSDVEFGQKRSSPGKVEPKIPVKEEPFDPNKYKINAADLAKLDTYLKDAKTWKENLEKLRKYLPSTSGKKETAKSQQTPQKYLDYLKAEVLTAAAPRIIAKQAVMDKVQIPSLIFGSSKIELKNLSDAPGAYGRPVSMDINSLKTEAKTNITIDYSKQIPELKGTFTGFDMSKIQSSLSNSAGIIFESGKASGIFKGTATKEAIDLTFDIDISNMKAQAAKGKSILGLNQEAVTEALKVLNNLKTTIHVVGPVTEPRLVFNVQGLTKQFEEALKKAGKEKLSEELNKQIDKQLGDKAPQEIKDAGQKVIQGLGGLLGGRSGQ